MTFCFYVSALKIGKSGEIDDRKSAKYPFINIYYIDESSFHSMKILYH